MNSLEGFTVDYRQYSTIFDRRQSIQSSGGKWEKEEPLFSARQDGGHRPLPTWTIHSFHCRDGGSGGSGVARAVAVAFSAASGACSCNLTFGKHA